MEGFLNFLKREDVKEFIQKNLETDVQKLLLNPPVEFRKQIKGIADQVISRQKIKRKLPQWYEDSSLIMPPPVSAEQASSFTTCQYKASLIQNKKTHYVDLTGGMGADCLYLSQEFEQVTYVDTNAHLCEVFRHNSSQLERNIKVIHDTAENYLNNLKISANTLFYLDPDRRPNIRSRVFKIEDCRPDLRQIISLVKGVAFRMLVKFSPLLDISSILDMFEHISDVHVISVKNDCKEILLDIHSDFEGEPKIHCINLETTQPVFSFSIAEEKNSPSLLGNTQSYLCEPNSSILKAGAFKLVAQRLGLKKISTNTHLYATARPPRSFPGRVFKIIDTVTKEGITSYAPDRKINVLVRNHPQTPQQIKAKWKVQDGGDYFLLGYRDINGKPKMYIAERFLAQDNSES